MVKDYKELIKALRETDLSECPCEDPTLCVGKDCVVLQAADAIEEMLAAVPRWISVGERLPEDVDCYLCRIDCANGKWLEVCKYTENQNFASFYNGEDATDFVTHWMPLLEPPEEDAK